MLMKRSLCGIQVRQMFEDRRNQINGRPPLQPTYAKNHMVRRTSPTKGRDRSHPLDPLPVKSSITNRQAGNQRQPAVNYRSRGASLERGGRQDRFDEDRIRRSKSQFQVDEILASVARIPDAKPSRSMNSLLVDDNQNDVDVYDAPTVRRPYRYDNPGSINNHINNDVYFDGGAGGMRRMWRTATLECG